MVFCFWTAWVSKIFIYANPPMVGRYYSRAVANLLLVGEYTLVSGITKVARSPKLRKGQIRALATLFWPFRNFGDLATLVIPETKLERGAVNKLVLCIHHHTAAIDKSAQTIHKLSRIAELYETA